MPVQFLSAHQRATYGDYTASPSEDELARYFHLDEADLERALSKRGTSNRLGFALQLATVRYLGRFPDDLTVVPGEVVTFVAKQLELPTPSQEELRSYRRSRWIHREEICALCGYREWTSKEVGFRLTRWLYERCWMGTDRPILLFERATLWLLANKVLLPGASLLERFIARLRERVEERICSLLLQGLSATQQEHLESWLSVPEGARRSLFDELRTGQTHISGPALVRALKRLNQIREEGSTSWNNKDNFQPRKYSVAPTRLDALSSFALRAKVTALWRMNRRRRLAVLVAFSRAMETHALDEVLEILEQILSDLFTEAAKADQKVRLRHLRDLDGATSTLAQVCRWLLDDSLTPDDTGFGTKVDVRDAIFARISREQLVHVIEEAQGLIRPPDAIFYRELEAAYGRVKVFLPLLLRSVVWQGTPGTAALTAAWSYLHQHHRSGKRQFDDEVPLSIVSSNWKRFVFPDLSSKEKTSPARNIDPKAIDICAYTFCVLDQLRGAIKRREVFVSASIRYGDPRQGLLTPAAWETARPLICRTLGWEPEAKSALTLLKQELDDTYRRVQNHLPSNTDVRFEGKPEQEELVLTPLEKLDEPDSLTALRTQIYQRLPRVDIPEILLEIEERTRFASAFTHVAQDQGGYGGRADDLSLRAGNRTATHPDHD